MNPQLPTALPIFLGSWATQARQGEVFETQQLPENRRGPGPRGCAGEAALLAPSSVHLFGHSEEEVQRFVPFAMDHADVVILSPGGAPDRRRGCLTQSCALTLCSTHCYLRLQLSTGHSSPKLPSLFYDKGLPVSTPPPRSDGFSEVCQARTPFFLDHKTPLFTTMINRSEDSGDNGGGLRREGVDFGF